MFDITCSIVLYHNPIEEVKKAVESFLKCTKNVKLFLVDNSKDDTLRYKFLSPRIEYIFNGKNLGYGAANNVAIRRAIGVSRYHLILNPDIEFKTEILDDLFLFMERNRSVGSVMPKVLYKNGDLQYLCKRLPSPVDLFLRRFLPAPLKVVLNKQLEKYELRDKNYNAIMDVPNLSGCFMFVRTEVFSSIGLFDEQYFLYMEDTDLCRRINKYYRTVYYPQVSIIHGYSKASYKTFKLTRYHLNSSIRYFNKWGWMKDINRQYINGAINRNCLKLELKLQGQNTIIKSIPQPVTAS